MRSPAPRPSRSRWLPAVAAAAALALGVPAWADAPTPARADAPLAALAGPVGCTSAPFISSAAAKSWYRIPAVVRTGSGAVIAFAERRDNATNSDRGNFDLVARTSTDGGCHWGPLRVVADDGNAQISSPVPVWDPVSSTVLLFSSVRDSSGRYRGLYLQRSTDDGANWTPLRAGKIAVTVSHRGQWKGGLQGPGHAIVLQHGTHAGRIIVPLGYRVGRSYGSYALFSDDQARSWRVGFDRRSPGSTQLIEGTITELASGRLLVSYRDKRKTKPGRNRLIASSVDGGATISAFRRMPGVSTMAVQGSLLLPTTPGAPLVFSSPSFIATKNTSIRRGMRLFVSSNGGASWHRGPAIGSTRRPASYSDLTELSNGGVGVLYETGRRSWRERIVFTQVGISALG